MFPMKQMIALAVIAVVALGAVLTVASYNTGLQSERSFEVAQRRCPNGRC